MSHFILITGASSGIGESTARLLAKQGYKVLAGVRKQSDADRLKTSDSGNIHPVLLDVTDQDSIDKAVEKATELIGEASLVGIINNAGIAVGGPVL